MIKFARFALLSSLAGALPVQGVAHAAAVVTPVVHTDGALMQITEGKMVYGADGRRLAPVYRVMTDGAVQLILDGRLVTIPAAVLAEVHGKLTVPDTTRDVLR